MPAKAPPSEETRIRQARLVLELRSRGVSNNVVLRAIERVPREAFLPAQYADYAYDDRQLPLPCGQVSLEPYILARMFEAMRPMPMDRVLLIGSGLGYPAAVLGHMFRRVFVVERYRTLLLAAETALKENGISNVVTRLGDGLEGWEAEAPFDAILITPALESLPESLTAQARRPGRIVYPQWQGGGEAVITRVSLPKTGGEEMETFESFSAMPAVEGVARAL